MEVELTVLNMVWSIYLKDLYELELIFLPIKVIIEYLFRNLLTFSFYFLK